MGLIPVDDNSNEVLRKSAQASSDGTKYDLRTKIYNDELSMVMSPHQLKDLLTIQEKIIKELKITNLHLSTISGNEITDKDL